MKKLVLVAFAIVPFFMANAQLREKGSIELTPHIGYTSSVVAGDYADDLEAKSAVNFGVNADYYFSDRWSLRSGVNFDPMGAEDNFGNALKLNYVSIPLNANWHFGSTRKWNLNFGVTPSFLTSAKVNDVDSKSFYNSTQIGLSYGIGYKFSITDKISILIDYQGITGMSNILKDAKGYNNETLKQINGMSTFNVGGVFKL